MNSFDTLLDSAGTWHGSSTLQDPNTGAADVSEAVAVVTALLGGRFVRIDYTWAYHGEPQQGSMLIGYRRQSGDVTMHWIDTWHMGNDVMACTGRVEDAAISVFGSYAAPPDPDWGWRTVITPSLKALDVTMTNVSPDGAEETAVEARHEREPTH